MLKTFSRWLVLVQLAGLAGCASLMNGVTSQLADNLSAAILNSGDVATVREAVPAYLLLIDSFIVNDPNQAQLLMAAASLNGAYSVLVDEGTQGICCLVLGGQEVELDVPGVVINEAHCVAVAVK